MRQCLHKASQKVVFFAALAVCLDHAMAETDWIGPSGTYDSGNWSAPANWSPTGPPVAGDDVVIDNHGTSSSSPSITVNYDYTGAPLTLKSLRVTAEQEGPAATLSMASGNLSVSGTEFFGDTLGTNDYGTGIGQQSGGTNSAASLSLGPTRTDTGTYNLSASGMLNISGTESLGGTIDQTGGANTATSMQLGIVIDAGPSLIPEDGTCSISAGTASITNAVVCGASIFDASHMHNFAAGGTLTITGTGSLTTPSVTLNGLSTLNLSGGSLNTASIFLGQTTVGSVTNQATFNWTAGTLDITADTTFDPGGSGMGMFFGSAFAPGTGRTLMLSGNQTLGGTGNFTLTLSSGASNIVTRQLTITTGSKVNLTGGLLSAQSIDLNGANSNLNWTSGTLEISSNLTIDPNAASTATGSIFGNTLTLSGGKTLTVDGSEGLSDTNTQTTFTLNVNGGGTNTVVHTLGVAAHSTMNITGGTVAAHNTDISGTGRLNYSGGSFTPGSLTLSSGAIATFAISNHTFTLSALSLDLNSKLDMGRNTVVVQGGDVPAIMASIASAYDNGAWDGHGITASTAAASNPKAALGFVSDSATVTIKYTLVGDTNLDGSVNFTDLLAVAQNYGKSGTYWQDGDFNYDGSTNFSDLLGLAQNYGLSLTASQLSQLNADGGTSFASDFTKAQAQTAVPEPAALLSLFVTGLTLISRHGRMRRTG